MLTILTKSLKSFKLGLTVLDAQYVTSLIIPITSRIYNNLNYSVSKSEKGKIYSSLLILKNKLKTSTTSRVILPTFKESEKIFNKTANRKEDENKSKKYR